GGPVAGGPVAGGPVAGGPVAGGPVRPRRELWGVVLAGAALLIGLPWWCARSSAEGPAAVSTEVASAALRPSVPELRPTLAPASLPPEPSVAVVAEPSVAVVAASGVLPEAAVARLDAVQKVPDAPPVQAASVSPRAPAAPEPALQLERPAVGAAKVADAAQAVAAPVGASPPALVPSLVVPPSVAAVPPAASAPAAGAVPSGATPPPALPAQSDAAKAGEEPLAPAGQKRGANPWDLRDLEFE
ncbi:MAG: hypothetical protein ABI895_26685, partial [Deltaproteobacteria bacterium]